MLTRFRIFCLILLASGILTILMPFYKSHAKESQSLSFLTDWKTSPFGFKEISPRVLDSDGHSNLKVKSKETPSKEPPGQKLPQESPVSAQTELPWWERTNISHCDEYEGEVLHKNAFSSKSGAPYVPTVGHCGHRASQHGSHQKVVSYSLFGSNPAYSYGIPFILEDILKFYPGWNVRIHTNPELHYQFFCPLLKKYPNLSLCDVKRLPKPLGNVSHIDPMLWRSAPLGDEQVEWFIVRDTDSELSQREAAAVSEWVAYKKPVHLMRDHQHHSAEVMGGMFGIWQPPQMLELFEKMRKKLFVHNSRDDQTNLKRVMPRKFLERHSVQHCSFWCRLVGKCLPFPTQRQGGLFVGNAKYKRMDQNWTSSVRKCPDSCRPPDHKDWLYC